MGESHLDPRETSRPAKQPVGRHLHWRIVRRRRRLLRRGYLAALFAVVGPGLLAGLSDDDPAGITTYSILGAEHGYQMLWVLTLSTAALVIFHELAVRMGVVTGKGLMALIRERYGRLGAGVALGALLVANLGTLCAEFAGVAAGAELLGGTSRYLTVPLAAAGVSVLVLRSSFRRVEHVLLALTAIFAAYILSGILAHPDWGAAAHGLVVPEMPLDRDAVLIAVATLGTTLAPWGLSFIQSYAVDKKLETKDLSYERIDVIVGSVLTGVIGFFVVVASAATLHVSGVSITIERRGASPGAAGGPPRCDPVRTRLPRRIASGRGDSSVHRLLDRGSPRSTRRRRNISSRWSRLPPSSFSSRAPR